MDEKKKTVVQRENDTDYTVGELIEELLNDESWEPDPEYRQKAVGMLMMSIFPVC